MSTAERNFKVLLAPVASEKSSIVADKHRQYVFKVLKEATKPQIQKAVESMFKVNVEKVNVSNVKTKPKRFGRITGRSKVWKKAYVTLRDGQDITFMETGA